MRSIVISMFAFVCLAVPYGASAAGPGQLDHFLCFEATRQGLGLRGISAVDQFGDSTITVRQPKRLCAPANKNGEDPTAPSHAGHLSSVTINQSAPRFAGMRGLAIRDQFGTRSIDLARPLRLLVPTSKSLQAPPPPALATPLDHFKCYRVRKRPRLRLPDATVETQFGAVVVEIKQPLALCVPVDKNGEGIIDPSRSLMCYQARAAKQSTRHVYTTDQFGSADYDLTNVRDLCVPLLAGPGTCGDGKINDPSERCESGGGNDAACPGLCNALTCTCNSDPTGSATPSGGATPSPSPALTASTTATTTAASASTPTATTTAASTSTPTVSVTPTNGSTPGACAVNGTPCNDGDACTTVDTCQGGVCTGSSPVVCTASDQCHDAGTCNPATGACSTPPKANGAGCNDSNACTATDTCQSGTCTGSAPVVCTASSQCHNAGTCNPATGICSNPPKANGAGCNDGDVCTQTDTCTAGLCGGLPLNGPACDDGSLCTVNDSCRTGICTGDSTCGACTACLTTCNPATGQCSPGLAPTGTVCGPPPTDPECAQPSTCVFGTCTDNPLPDGTPCGVAPNQCAQLSTCQSGRCVSGALPDATACDDGNPCTLNDRCQAGTCEGHQKNCDDRVVLNFDTCNVATGACEHSPDPSRACPACGAPTRCCRQDDGSGGFDLACFFVGLACEDTTGTVGSLCGQTPNQYVCAVGSTCCGDGCCGAGDTCYQNKCYPGTGQICGNVVCRFGEEICDFNTNTCQPTCGGTNTTLVCLANELCCEAIEKCCAPSQACGVTDCEAPVICAPNEVRLQNECCLESAVCGDECCTPGVTYCNPCTLQCVYP